MAFMLSSITSYNLHAKIIKYIHFVTYHYILFPYKHQFISRGQHFDQLLPVISLTYVTDVITKKIYVKWDIFIQLSLPLRYNM